MICRRCGAEIPDWFVVCGICGTPVMRPRKKNKAEYERKRSFFSGLSVKLSVISLILLGFPTAAVITSIMSIMFGVIGLRRGEYGKRRAIAGIAIGGAALLLGVTLTICLAALSPYLQDIQKLFEDLYLSPNTAR